MRGLAPPPRDTTDVPPNVTREWTMPMTKSEAAVPRAAQTPVPG